MTDTPLDNPENYQTPATGSAPPAGNPYAIPADLQQIIEQALAAQRADFEAQQKVLQDQITVLQSSIHGAPVTMLAEHSAGPGNQTAETWGQFHQERSWAEKERVLAG